MTTATIPDVMTVPSDVLEHALQINVKSELYLALATAKETMPQRRVTTYLEHDPEIENEMRIVVDIDVTGVPLEERVAARQRYRYLLGDRCPPSQTGGVFVLRLSINP